jgi:glycosyltransferase involved in cell wall biosynthesis
MTVPTVTVIIPTYNRANLIREAIDSVFAQTYTDFEIIIADDGSTDNTAEVVAGYKDAVTFIQGTHQGAAGSHARNLGLRQASGHYIGFLDSDDFWLPHKLAKQIAFMQSYPKYAWCYTDAAAFDGATGGVLYKYSDTHRMTQGDVLEDLFRGNFIPSITPLIRREVFADIGEFWPTPKLTDWDMMLRIAANHEVAYLSDVTAHVRIHRQRVTDASHGMQAYEAGVNVLQRALSRDSERLTPHYGDAHAALCLRSGLGAARLGDLATARTLFARSFRLQTNYRPILYWCSTLLGNKLLQRIGQVRMQLRQRQSGH